MPTEPDANDEGNNEKESNPSATASPSLVGYPVSLKKFLIMSLCTMPLAHAYVLFWAYKNFCTFGFKKRTKLASAVFTFFLPISLHELLRMLETRTAIQGNLVKFHKTIVSVIYIILKVIGGMHGRAYSDKFPLSELLDILGVLLLLWVASRVLLANPKEKAIIESNSRFTKWNIAGCILGALAWILIGINAVTPEAQMQGQPTPTPITQ